MGVCYRDVCELLYDGLEPKYWVIRILFFFLILMCFVLILICFSLCGVDLRPGSGPGNTGPDLLGAYRYQYRYQILSLICWTSFQPYPFVQVFVPDSDGCASSVDLFNVLELLCLVVSLHILCVSHKLFVWDPRACNEDGCWVPRGESPLFGHCNGYLSITLSSLLNGRSPDL